MASRSSICQEVKAKWSVNTLLRDHPCRQLASIDTPDPDRVSLDADGLPFAIANDEPDRCVPETRHEAIGIAALHPSYGLAFVWPANAPRISSIAVSMCAMRSPAVGCTSEYLDDIVRNPLGEARRD